MNTMTKTCENCIIGLFYTSDDRALVTFPELCENVKLQNETERMMVTYYQKSPHYVHLSEYFDRRKSLNAYMFHYCPVCGAKIDTKLLKEKALEEERKW